MLFLFLKKILPMTLFLDKSAYIRPTEMVQYYTRILVLKFLDGLPTARDICDYKSSNIYNDNFLVLVLTNDSSRVTDKLGVVPQHNLLV